jgi:hypothetical protein
MNIIPENEKQKLNTQSEIKMLLCINIEFNPSGSSYS